MFAMSTGQATQISLATLQHRARDAGYHVLLARNFEAHRDTPAGVLGPVLVFDLAGRSMLAKPVDLAAAAAFLEVAKRYRNQFGRPFPSGGSTDPTVDACYGERGPITH